MTTTVGAGIGGSFGLAAEGTWGTFTAPTRWPEFQSESLELKPKRISGQGIANGTMVQRGTQRQTTSATVEGDFKTAVFVKGMGLIWAHLLGSAAPPAQQGVTAAYLQTQSLQSAASLGLSCQVGRPDLAGLVHQYNYIGNKIVSVQLECGVDEPLMATVTLDGKDCQESSAYTVPTYLTANPYFAFEDAVFSTGAFGAEVPVAGVRKWTLTIERPWKVDNFYMDGTGRKQQQVQNGFVKISGTLETDFIDKTKYVDLFLNDTPQSQIVTFTKPGTIPSGGSNPFQFKVSIPEINYDGEPPKIGGPDIISPKMSFTGYYDDSHNPLTMTYMSTDTVL